MLRRKLLPRRCWKSSVRPRRRSKQPCPRLCLALWFLCTFCILMPNNNLSAENKCSCNKHPAFNSSCADGCVAVELCACTAIWNPLQTESYANQEGSGIDVHLFWTTEKNIWQSRICHNQGEWRRKKPRNISLAGCSKRGERFNRSSEDWGTQDLWQ